MKPLRCPKCRTGRLCPSRRRGFDWLLALVALKPYRCLRCEARDYRLGF